MKIVKVLVTSFLFTGIAALWMSCASTEVKKSARWDAYPGCTKSQCREWKEDCSAECINQKETSVTECETKCGLKLSDCETSCSG